MIHRLEPRIEPRSFWSVMLLLWVYIIWCCTVVKNDKTEKPLCLNSEGNKRLIWGICLQSRS